MNSVAEPNFGRVPKPAHVADDLVVDFDLHRPVVDGDVYGALTRLHAGPDIQWTPCNGGHWIVTRAEDIRWVQENFAIFSHEVFHIPRGTIRPRMPPLTADPPVHARYRMLFNPFFRVPKAKEMAERARALTIETITAIRERGQCEFVHDFAQVMPLIAFLSVVDLPFEEREQFVAWGKAYSKAPDQQARDQALAVIVGYLKEVLQQRHESPGEDLLSAIAKWRDSPHCESEDEIIGMALLIFLGGLDTVANMLSFTAWHLATHPEHRRRLREDPAMAPRAAEEYLRRHGLSNTGRLIVSDVERKGATMKAGEMIMVPIGLSSLDERKYPDPFTIDFDRPQTFDGDLPAHDTFGNGPHRCVGAPLARAELVLFLQEWLALIPDFELDPDHSPTTHMGFVNGVDSLHLRWG